MQRRNPAIEECVQRLFEWFTELQKAKRFEQAVPVNETYNYKQSMMG